MTNDLTSIVVSIFRLDTENKNTACLNVNQVMKVYKYLTVTVLEYLPVEQYSNALPYTHVLTPLKIQQFVSVLVSLIFTNERGKLPSMML